VIQNRAPPSTQQVSALDGRASPHPIHP
jgi:hypothetical protein